MSGCGGVNAAFDFDDHIGGIAYKTRLSTAQQDEIKTAFCSEVAKVVDWFRAQGWFAPPSAGAAAGAAAFNPAGTHLQVFVSTEYPLSRALVPAALGKRGHMEFPLYRVMAGEAALAHEIAHVLFPNGNRFLAEGFAVYVQQAMGSNPAFPNFGYDLEQAVHTFVRHSNVRIEDIELGQLDQLSTPDDLIMKIGVGWYSYNATYLLAGSFVKFLIDTHGPAKFRELYLLTPLKPLDRNGGGPERWHAVYGATLAMLETEWKKHIKSLHASAPIEGQIFQIWPQAYGAPAKPDHRNHHT